MVPDGVFADMDLCNTVEHGCEHQCVSAPGSYYCICPEGQLLQEDGKSCGSKSSLTNQPCRTIMMTRIKVVNDRLIVTPMKVQVFNPFIVLHLLPKMSDCTNIFIQ